MDVTRQNEHSFIRSFTRKNLEAVADLVAILFIFVPGDTPSVFKDNLGTTNIRKLYRFGTFGARNCFFSLSSSSSKKELPSAYLFLIRHPDAARRSRSLYRNARKLFPIYATGNMERVGGKNREDCKSRRRMPKSQRDVEGRNQERKYA